MPMPLDSMAAKKAGYLILTAAFFHLPAAADRSILLELRRQLAREMSAEDLLEVHYLKEVLVTPRF